MTSHRSQFTTIRCDAPQCDIDCDKCNGTGRVLVRHVAEKPSWGAVAIFALAGFIVACGLVLLTYWRN